MKILRHDMNKISGRISDLQKRGYPHRKIVQFVKKKFSYTGITENEIKKGLKELTQNYK
jgi:hypothetical protein